MYIAIKIKYNNTITIYTIFQVARKLTGLHKMNYTVYKKDTALACYK